MQSPITKDQATTPRSHSGACKRNGESFYAKAIKARRIDNYME
jgi:hypothetical protein